MTVIPDMKAVQQLKQYYQLIEDGRASMQKGGGKRKKGGTRHKKLGIKIKEMHNKIKEMHNKIKFLEKTRAFAVDQDELERDILTNTNEIKIIRDYINKIFKPTTSSVGATQIDNWNSSAYVNDPDIRVNDPDIRSYNGGRRKPKKRRRNKKTKRKRRRNKKTRRKKSRK